MKWLFKRNLSFFDWFYSAAALILTPKTPLGDLEFLVIIMVGSVVSRMWEHHYGICLCPKDDELEVDMTDVYRKYGK